MVIEDTAVRGLAFLPWNAVAGVPERIVQAPATSLLGDTLPSVRRAELDVRALPDGALQVLAPLDGGGRVVRLSQPPARIDFDSAGQVIDAVMRADGHAIVLERAAHFFTAREVAPNGSSGPPIVNLAISADAPPRLLADARRQVFVASNDQLIRLDDGVGRTVARWQPGGQPLMHPDGRLAFVRYDAARGIREWVLLDPETGAQSSVDGSEDAWLILGRPVGVDAKAQAYGYSARVLGRMAADGRLDWRLEIAGAAVSGPDDVTLMYRREDCGWTLLRGGASILVDPSDECAGAQLVGHREDGGYVLYKRAGSGFGTLLQLNSGGRLIGYEPARDDVWLTCDDLRPPSVSSVTPAGEVAVAVLAPGGVHVIGLRAAGAA